jgi:hypothetical protein
MAVGWILMFSINLNRIGGLNTKNLALKLRPAAVLGLNLSANVSLTSKR